MREIDVSLIIDEIEKLCIDANMILPTDVSCVLIDSVKRETNSLAKSILSDLVENMTVAKELNVPICQDTGMAVVFVEVGQDVHITGGLLMDAINEGVRRGYKNGYLRLSIVKDPLRRINTNDNTPAIIHTNIVEGDKINIMVAPKGFGSENMSSIKMFNPSATKQEIVEFVVSCVKNAGSNPCPPVIVGVGIGGDFEYSALLSKKALCRKLDKRNTDSFYKDLEDEMLLEINKLSIGPQGFGGDITALCVNIESFPTHIAGLPVAVNMGCHVTRHKSVVI